MNCRRLQASEGHSLPGDGRVDGLPSVFRRVRVGDDLAGTAREPLAILTALAAKFGIRIKAGNRSGPLVALATIPMKYLTENRGRYEFMSSAGSTPRRGVCRSHCFSFWT